mmetsp:Transcript_3529/g.11489  ORF Transcript_3529/g.11489 Transcript_3529/m.11489 type:complete len:200 (-) Transcript_3529:2576-3175(-)
MFQNTTRKRDTALKTEHSTERNRAVRGSPPAAPTARVSNHARSCPPIIPQGPRSLVAALSAAAATAAPTRSRAQLLSLTGAAHNWTSPTSGASPLAPRRRRRRPRRRRHPPPVCRWSAARRRPSQRRARLSRASWPRASARAPRTALPRASRHPRGCTRSTASRRAASRTRAARRRSGSTWRSATRLANWPLHRRTGSR